jgi:hypothetical protein
MIAPEIQADWIVGQAGGFQHLPTLMKKPTSL